MLTKEETLTISRQALHEMGLEDRYTVADISWPCSDGQWSATFRHRYGILFPVCVDWSDERDAKAFKAELKRKLCEFKARPL